MRLRLHRSLVQPNTKQVPCFRVVIRRHIKARSSADFPAAQGRRPTQHAASVPADPQPDLGARFRALLVSTLSSIAVVLSSSLPVGAAESLTIRFPASRDPEIRAAQEVLVQAWGYVRELYVDPTFNKQDWKQRLQDSLNATFKAASRDEALEQVSVMLESLGDPFTRVLLPGGPSEAFRAMTKAKIVSTGLLVARLGSPDGPLQVSAVVTGSPAAEAGLRVGDEVVAVNGRPVWALGGDSEALEGLLRQDVEVQLKLLRPADPAERAGGGGPGGGAGGGGGGGSSRQTAAAARRSAASASAAQGPPPLPTFAGPDLDLDLVSAPELAAANGGGGGAAQGIADGLPLERMVYGVADSSVEPSTRSMDAAAPAVSTTDATVATLPPPSSTPTPSTSYPLPGSFFNVVLRPAPVEFVPVQYAVLDKDTIDSRATRRGAVGFRANPTVPFAPSSASSASPAVQPSPARVGYIRIVAFTENVGEQVESAVRTLQAAGCGSWLLDVRGNPGGIVGEGIRVAELLLPPGQVFARVRDRGGEELAERLADTARPLVAGQPLALLVDHYSASTSELLAGALHDDAHALLLGERTYGKGRTQRVVQLNGGATLLVSTDTYVTPGRRAVDRVGLPPDVACRPGPPPPPVPRPLRTPPPAEAGSPQNSSDGSGDGAGGEGVGHIGDGGIVMAREQVRALAQDACVRAAVGKLSRG